MGKVQKRKSISVRPEIHARAKQACDRAGQAVSAFTEEAIVEKLEREWSADLPDPEGFKAEPIVEDLRPAEDKEAEPTIEPIDDGWQGGAA